VQIIGKRVTLSVGWKFWMMHLVYWTAAKRLPMTKKAEYNLLAQHSTIRTSQIKKA